METRQFWKNSKVLQKKSFSRLHEVVFQDVKTIANRHGPVRMDGGKDRDIFKYSKRLKKKIIFDLKQQRKAALYQDFQAKP